MGALAAGFWGFVGGASLLMGALVGVYADSSRRIIAAVMALGAGVLISSVAFELMDDAYQMGGFDASVLGLSLGAVAFFFADRGVRSRYILRTIFAAMGVLSRDRSCCVSYYRCTCSLRRRIDG